MEAGASHVIVTSYLFQGASVRFVCLYVDLARGSSTDGPYNTHMQLDFGRLEALSKAVGKERLVCALSYRIVSYRAVARALHHFIL